MRRGCNHLVLMFPLLFMWVGTAAHADGPFAGVDVGVSIPTNKNYVAHVHEGATANPYLGYMFNDYLGVQGQVHVTAQEPDNDHRGYPRESQTTSLFGGTIGPRLSLPLGNLVELYGTGQGGVFSGLSGTLNHTAPGFSVGGGVDFNLTPQLALGVFGRWNRAYMAPRPTFLSNDDPDASGPADARWATAGIGLKYAFNEPPAPPAPAPPPPPVAQAPPAPPPARKKIVLRSVHFDFDKSAIRPDAAPVLNEAAETLKAAGSVVVIVEGHTDSKGSDSYNMKLSQRRAQAVAQYLVKRGIPSDHIKTEGYGESRPVASNDTADGRAQNRRVELRIE